MLAAVPDEKESRASILLLDVADARRRCFFFLQIGLCRSAFESAETNCYSPSAGWAGSRASSRPRWRGRRRRRGEQGRQWRSGDHRQRRTSTPSRRGRRSGFGGLDLFERRARELVFRTRTKLIGASWLKGVSKPVTGRTVAIVRERQKGRGREGKEKRERKKVKNKFDEEHKLSIFWPPSNSRPSFFFLFQNDRRVDV